MQPYVGELAGIGAALCWAVAGLLFARIAVAAAGINLFKNLLSALLLALLLGVLALVRGGAWLHADAVAWGWLAASACVGLFLGDTFHFRSLQILGPRRALVLETLAPVFGAALGWWLLAEPLGGPAGAGVLLTVLGVAWVIRERSAGPESLGHFPGTRTAGEVQGVLAAACQALGAAWSKKGILHLEELAAADPALEAAMVRLLAASAFGLLAGAFGGRLGRWTAQVRTAGVLPLLVPASVIGTALGIALSMVAFQHASIAVATTLTAMSPILVLPLVVLFLRQRVTARAVVGAAIAVAGVALLVVR